MAVKVYAIRNRTSEGVYIGTTTKQYLSQRWAHHTHGARKHQEGKPIRWCSSFQILACPTASIELLEECSEDMRKERERHWIETTPNCVNKHYKPKTEDDRIARRTYNRERMRVWRSKRKLEPVEVSREVVDVEPEVPLR